MSQVNTYWDKLTKLKEAVELYKSMDFVDFIMQSLSYSGFDLRMMDNVYINEICIFPDTYGCYKEGDTVYSYVVNERGQKQIESYTQDKLMEFMLSFVRTAPNMRRHNFELQRNT